MSLDPDDGYRRWGGDSCRERGLIDKGVLQHLGYHWGGGGVEALHCAVLYRNYEHGISRKLSSTFFFISHLFSNNNNNNRERN